MIYFNPIGARQHFIKEVYYMNTNNELPFDLPPDCEGYLNIPIFEGPKYSNFYDREVDQQGIVPGRTFEEAEAAFLSKFQIS